MKWLIISGISVFSRPYNYLPENSASSGHVVFCLVISMTLGSSVYILSARTANIVLKIVTIYLLVIVRRPIDNYAYLANYFELRDSLFVFILDNGLIFKT